MNRGLLLLAALLALACDDTVDFGGDAGPGALPDVSVTCGRGGDLLCPVVEPLPGTPKQPRRYNPTEVVISADGARAFVALTGSEAQPGASIAVVNLASATVEAPIESCPRPVGLALHPAGRFLVVSCSYARHLAVIDTERRQVVGRLPLTFYAEGLAFDPGGTTLLVADRQHDGLWSLGVELGESGLVVPQEPRFVALGNNPSQVSVCPDGRFAFVTLTGDRSVARVELGSGQTERLDLQAPPNDVLCLGTTAIVATLGSGSGHPRESSRTCAQLKADFGDHMRCDSTDNTRFSDIQNELAVIDVASMALVQRFTSDSAEDSELDAKGAISPALMRVRGAFPRALAASDRGVFVSFSASAQVQVLGLPGGVSGWTGRDFQDGPVWDVGFGAHGLALTPDGATLVVANRLAEDVSLIDVASGVARRVTVGNDGPPFPATDEEVGELFFFGAYFSADGDGSCSHCHPDATTDGKAWSVATVPLGASRGVPATRHLGATVPLLLEGTQDQNGFNLEMEDLSPRIDYDPDPSDTYERGRQARDSQFRQISQRLIGRPIGFQQMVERVGQFLVHEPRLLPNPNPLDTPEVVRGRALYVSADVACDTCHPVADGFTTNERFQEVIATRRGDEPNREIPSVIALNFENAARGVFDTPSLRGLWDRPSRFLHDGRAQTIAETFLTPDHPALKPGEQGFNFGGSFEPSERIFDTHGGASQLTARDVEDLLAFLITIE